MLLLIGAADRRVPSSSQVRQPRHGPMRTESADPGGSEEIICSLAIVIFTRITGKYVAGLPDRDLTMDMY